MGEKIISWKQRFGVWEKRPPRRDTWIQRHPYITFLLLYLATILLFAGAYFQYGVFTSGGEPYTFSKVDMIYFSVVTITTLGYGDIVPADALTKNLCWIEALFGVLVMGGFLVTVSYKLIEGIETKKEGAIRNWALKHLAEHIWDLSTHLFRQDHWRNMELRLIEYGQESAVRIRLIDEYCERAGIELGSTRERFEYLVNRRNNLEPILEELKYYFRAGGAYLTDDEENGFRTLVGSLETLVRRLSEVTGMDWSESKSDEYDLNEFRVQETLFRVSLCIRLCLAAADRNESQREWEARVTGDIPA